MQSQTWESNIAASTPPYYKSYSFIDISVPTRHLVEVGAGFSLQARSHGLESRKAKPRYTDIEPGVMSDLNLLRDSRPCGRIKEYMISALVMISILE